MTLLTQEFVDALLISVLRPATIEPGETCSICVQAYGSPMAVDINTNSKLLGELPYYFYKSFKPHTTKSVMTPCNHHFCVTCICTWLIVSTTCPHCRATIPLHPSVRNSRNLFPEDDNHLIHIFSREHNISETSARRIITILRYNSRSIIKYEPTQSISFVWNAQHMTDDLTRIMAQVARRFHYQSVRPLPQPFPRDDPLFRPHKIFDRPGGRTRLHLRAFSTTDAPLLQSVEVLKMHELLCERIRERENELRLAGVEEVDWEPAVDYLTELVEANVPKPESVTEVRWWAYIGTVVQYLINWQCLCEEGKKLAQNETQ